MRSVVVSNQWECGFANTNRSSLLTAVTTEGVCQWEWCVYWQTLHRLSSIFRRLIAHISIRCKWVLFQDSPTHTQTQARQTEPVDFSNNQYAAQSRGTVYDLHILLLVATPAPVVPSELFHLTWYMCSLLFLLWAPMFPYSIHLPSTRLSTLGVVLAV